MLVLLQPYRYPHCVRGLHVGGSKMSRSKRSAGQRQGRYGHSCLLHSSPSVCRACETSREASRSTPLKLSDDLHDRPCQIHAQSPAAAAGHSHTRNTSPDITYTNTL